MYKGEVQGPTAGPRSTKQKWALETDAAVAAAREQAQADADERLAAREQQWRATAKKAQQAAVDEALAAAAAAAVATRAAEQARWAAETDEAVAAAQQQAQEAAKVPGPDGQFDHGLRLLDSDAKRSEAGEAAIQAWQDEDALTEPESATGWKRFLRRSKPPTSSAEGGSSGS